MTFAHVLWIECNFATCQLNLVSFSILKIKPIVISGVRDGITRKNCCLFGDNLTQGMFVCGFDCAFLIDDKIQIYISLRAIIYLWIAC